MSTLTTDEKLPVKEREQLLEDLYDAHALWCQWPSESLH